MQTSKKSLSFIIYDLLFIISPCPIGMWLKQLILIGLILSKKNLSWKNKANLRMGKMSVSIYMKGRYESFVVLGCEKTKPIQSQFYDVGLDAIWIPAFAGMTNMESQHDGIL